MGIEEIQHAVVAFTVKGVFSISHEKAILDVEADGLGKSQPYVFLPF
jgi:hypothetical protein